MVEVEPGDLPLETPLFLLSCGGKMLQNPPGTTTVCCIPVGSKTVGRMEQVHAEEHKVAIRAINGGRYLGIGVNGKGYFKSRSIVSLVDCLRREWGGGMSLERLKDDDVHTVSCGDDRLHTDDWCILLPHRTSESIIGASAFPAPEAAMDPEAQEKRRQDIMRLAELGVMEEKQ